MRALAIIVAAVGMGCASPQPSTYEKGAYRPLPARTQPRVGPSFQPGAPAPQVEPAPRPPPVPHTPKTRSEDTIWASTRPPAEWDRHLFGLELPVPPDAEDYDTRMVSHCAGALHIAIKNPDRRVVPGIQPKDAPCLYAGLYRFCAEKMVLHSDPGKAARHEAVRRTAQEFHLKMCTRKQLADKTIGAVLSAAADTWERADIHTTVPFE